MNIHPVSDLRYHYPEIEEALEVNESVILTKNGYACAVIMSVERYEELTDPFSARLREVEKCAASTDVRMTHEEVFSKIRDQMHE